MAAFRGPVSASVATPSLSLISEWQGRWGQRTSFSDRCAGDVAGKEGWGGAL